MGLCAVADVVLATADATFGFTETKLGLLPAVISPFVLAKIGESHARALFPTGERFGAERARQIGLVHEVLADEAALDARLDAVIAELLAAGPTAARAAKALIRELRTLSAADAPAHTVRLHRSAAHLPGRAGRAERVPREAAALLERLTPARRRKPGPATAATIATCLTI